MDDCLKSWLRACVKGGVDWMVSTVSLLLNGDEAMRFDQWSYTAYRCRAQSWWHTHSVKKLALTYQI
jgi:hypothetical protein